MSPLCPHPYSLTPCFCTATSSWEAAGGALQNTATKQHNPGSRDVCVLGWIMKAVLRKQWGISNLVERGSLVPDLTQHAD